MERHGGGRCSDHFAMATSFSADGDHYHNDDGHDGRLHGGYHHHHHNFNGEQSDSTGYHLNGNSNHSTPLSGQKRQISPSSYGGFVKLYVVGVPRTATEQDISAVFGEFGKIVEVVLLKDKWTGFQQECCFVKYATIEQADRAIGAFQNQYTFPGAAIPMKVKYAGGEHERLGTFGAHIHKLYVGCLNRHAFKWEIEEIFAPFGNIEEVFIVRDEFKKSRGCAFVQYSCREMAIAAIRALHGTFVMRGCDQPLIVRFAAPKKPRLGDSRPASYGNDSSNEHMLSSETQQMKSSDSGCKTAIMTSSGTAPVSHACTSISETEHPIECDWSEHVSPDGDLYYYNCATCESKWEKPEEYALYEQDLDNLEEQEQQQQDLKTLTLSSPEVSEAQIV